MEAVNRRRIRPSNLAYQIAIYTYGTHASVGIRRLLDRDKKTFSLRVLLKQIRNNSQVITRRSFVQRYRKELRDVASIEFERIAGSRAKSLPRDVVQKDLNRLVDVTTRIIKTVDKRIAHHERRPRAGRLPKWREIHQAISTMEDITLRYEFILHQSAPSSLRPANIMEYEADWLEIWGDG
ncbi:MAG: hypothetical protein JSV91_09200 [Phycisphaerales bacterium]|nr:MAG: hypothetical protein JSV91_09200 [Phycisphaerales bacterium]